MLGRREATFCSGKRYISRVLFASFDKQILSRSLNVCLKENFPTRFLKVFPAAVVIISFDEAAHRLDSPCRSIPSPKPPVFSPPFTPLCPPPLLSVCWLPARAVACRECGNCSRSRGF